MGRHRNPYRRELCHVDISDTAKAFLYGYGGVLSKEPLYRRLDRFIANCREKDKVEKLASQANVIQYYLDRIHKLEQGIQGYGS